MNPEPGIECNPYLGVDAGLGKVLPERGQRPLVALAALGVLVGGVGRVVLVDGVVGEVHEDVGERGVVRLVLVGGEPHEALVVEVDDERVDAGDQDVDAQVVLGAVDEVGPGDVPLHDHGGVLWYLGPLVHHLDAVAASQLKMNLSISFSDKFIN